jgi:hypothetical protein
MHQKVLLRGGAVLLFLALSIAYVNGQDTTTDTPDTTSVCTGGNCQSTAATEPVTQAATTIPPTTARATTLRPTTRTPTKRTTAARTKRPSKYDSDESFYDDDEDDEYESLNVYIAEGRRRSRFSRVRFPVRHYRGFRRFSIDKYPRLVSALPSVPMYYDRVTYQTVIFSPKGGLYILPPLINYYGQRFSVAQLIKWGYASLVSSGERPPASVDVATLVQPGSNGNEQQGQFSNGVQVNLRYLSPQYSRALYGGGYANYGSPYGNVYSGTGK